MRASPSIIYTWTDEAPFLATHAFLPVVRAFAGAAGVPVETRDISLAGRVLAAFADLLPDAQKRPDDLAELGRIVERPDANIIKLPNISASVPQLKACIRELQAKGFQLPDYPDEPATDEERDIRARYDRVKGSAVNPVLRQGNSDRRAPKAVKDFARANPPRMKPWPADSRTHVATMQTGDFFSNERSITLDQPATVRIEHVAPDGTVTVLRDGLALEAGEVFDSTVMSRRHLVAFLEQQVRDAKESGVLFSLHLKATMMKVSDPIIFGHAVRVYFQDVFRKHEAVFEKIGVNPNNGLGDVLARIAELPNAQRAEIEADIRRAYESGPPLAMVDSARGITNLHVPSDVIIDASMPPMIRDGGRMWNAAGELQDCKAVIPDSSYAGIYQAVIDDCREHGQFDPATMGSVSNVGLMAQKAEEYGSHDKTFEIERDGVVRVVSDGHVLIEHSVEAGDIWRACQTKDVAIRDWVRLAVARARATGNPAVFWLDRNRAHDAQIIRKVEAYLPEHDTSGLTIEIMKPSDAMRYSLERIRRGEDTISVTGNVLRDYLTDLFPILEIGTSARMLSIVPLLNGGGLFETGAGGSAPKHVQQFLEEGHLRWDSLGEYMALAASFEHLAAQFDNAGARVLAETLDRATAAYLQNGREPSRKVNEIDNRGSTFYLTLYWARALADQSVNRELAERFRALAAQLSANEQTIIQELNAAQGSPQDIGGYYMPDRERTAAAMRPSATFNAALDMLENVQAQQAR
ncbi:MAG: NADP-dependent isocitrate dehydrogenase [Candidatus Cloacimonetes bacterium]|nr:NADP-dependent isocitrate dehydrogenase [Candidatus Cloacimonadota bacterium]